MVEGFTVKKFVVLSPLLFLLIEWQNLQNQLNERLSGYGD